MRNKELKVVVNVYNNVNVDAEKVKIDMMNRIDNPIDLAKYVNLWLHSNECINNKFNEEMNAMYNNICKRLKERYTKEEDVCVRYYFSEDDWNMVIEVSRKMIR